jgi:hypothetical protein
MPARTQELALGIGFNAQSALQTALTAGDLWTLRSTAFNPAFPQLISEDDSADFNKGYEWVSTLFPSHSLVNWNWPYFLSSQNAAQVIVFALGKAVQSNPGTGAYQYEVTPMDPLVDGHELPATTIVAGLRQGSSGEILDSALIGAVCNDFEIRLASGPGRQSANINSNWMGCGKFVNNSGLTIPSVTAEKLLLSGGATVITFNGINYFSGANFVETVLNYNNNVPADAGFYPGSGTMAVTAGDFAIKGRIRFGARTVTLTHQAEMEAGSTEFQKIIDGTEGTVTITVRGALITGAIYHQISITFHRVRFKTMTLGESNGFVTVQVENQVMYHPSNGLMTVTIVTDKTGIG